MENKILGTSPQSLNNAEADQKVVPKPYQKPELTKYGGISSIVLAMGGMGADGSGFPPVSLT